MIAEGAIAHLVMDMKEFHVGDGEHEGRHRSPTRSWDPVKYVISHLMSERFEIGLPPGFVAPRSPGRNGTLRDSHLFASDGHKLITGVDACDGAGGMSVDSDF